MAEVQLQVIMFFGLKMSTSGPSAAVPIDLVYKDTHILILWLKLRFM